MVVAVVGLRRGEGVCGAEARNFISGKGGDDVRFRGGDVEMDDEVIAGEDDYCVGEVSNQDGHGLPIRSPLAYIDYNGSD